MITIGTATVCCATCGAQYDVPIHATPSPDPHALRLTVDPVDDLLLRLFADAHSGPIVTVQ